MREFANSNVIVLGAGNSIGQAVTTAFLRQGARVIAADGATAALAGLVPEPGQPGTLHHVTVDPSDPLAFMRACDELAGDIDVLVCTAPPIDHVRVLEMPASAMRDIIERELVTPALIMQEAARRMVAKGCGRIVVFCSMSGKTGVHTNVAPFAAAKGGLLAYLRVMAAELAAAGVTVNAVATSLFESQVASLAPDERQELTRGIPVRRFGRADEAAHAALFLASRNAAFITGETLNLSGGRFMD